METVVGSSSDVEMPVKPVEPTQKKLDEKQTKEVIGIRKKLVVPVVLIIIAVLLILVSAIFVSITYYQVMKVKNVSGLHIPNVSTYLLSSLIIIWIAFIISLVLLALNYFNYSSTNKNLDQMKEVDKRNSIYLWISVFIVAVLTLITGLICLYLSFKFKPLSNALFTNVLVATVTSIGAFIFVLFGAIFYGYNEGQFKQLYEDYRKKYKTYREKSKKNKEEKEIEKARKRLGITTTTTSTE